MNNETMVYPFTEEATSKLTRLMFFGKITKIAIVQPDNKPPYLIVDHTEYVRSDEPTIDGKPNITEEKRRTAINFNDTKDENKYKDDYMYDVWLRQLQEAERERTIHSRKPQIIRDRIVEMFGNELPKIELFARIKTDGWDVFGNEVEGSVNLETDGSNDR